MGTKSVQGLTFALLTAFFAAAFDLVTRFSSNGLTPWHMLLARGLFGLALTAILAKSLHLNLLGKNRTGMIGMGLITVIGVICLTVALIRLPIFEALLLLYLYPAFAALFSPLLVGDKSDLKLWMLIGLAFCGTGIMLWPGEVRVSLGWGHAFGIGAGLFQGLGLTLIRRYSSDNNPLTPFFYFCAVGAVVSLAALIISDAPFMVDRTGGLVLTAIAVTAALAQLSLCKALSCITAAEVGIIGMAEIVFGSVAGFLLFHEAVGFRQILGGFLVVASGIILAWGAAKAKPAVGSLPGVVG